MAVGFSRNNDCRKKILIRKNGDFIAYSADGKTHFVKSLKENILIKGKMYCLEVKVTNVHRIFHWDLVYRAILRI